MSVRSSFRQHLPWVSCERNSSYSFVPIILKLCMCLGHAMEMCIWFGYNCQHIFCHLFNIVDLVIFHPQYIDSGTSCEHNSSYSFIIIIFEILHVFSSWYEDAQLLLQFCTDCFETLHMLSSWYENVHVV